MNRRDFVLNTALGLGAATAAPLTHAQTPANAKLFRFVPHADLSILDPHFTTAFITTIHGQLVFDTLYGLDSQNLPQPQMAAGHVAENNGLLWKITLRDGLKFHDGTPVLARDVVASLNRWSKKDLLGRSLMEATEQMSAASDKVIQFKLKSPFPLILYALARPAGSMACIMPERLAQTADNVQIKQAIGSGPYRFVADKWVSGSQVIYERFAEYVPRKDSFAPSYTAGPKTARIEQIRWQIIADSATAIAALQNNEVDGIENIDNDFLGQLRKDPGIRLIKRSLPSQSVMRFNHLLPPFNHVDMRRAVMAVVSQTDYMTAINGPDFPEYWTDKCGVFVPGSAMDSTIGMEKMTGKRDFDKARALIKAAGYKGEPIVILDPVDYAAFHACALLTADLFKKLGLKVDVQPMNWGTFMQRRNSQEPTSAGGWNVAFTAITGPNNLDPAGHLALRGNGRKAWFGWPTNDRIEQLRVDWFKAPTLAEQKKICALIQQQVIDDVVYIPLGASYPVTALRKGWEDYQPQMPLFFNLRKA